MNLELPFAQVLLLLGCAVLVVLLFQRLHNPSSLAYLLVGLLLGPHTAGPVVDALPLQALAEFGIVFLLFTIGLNFALPQIHALRHLVLGLGTAQVALTTGVVAALAWAAGLDGAAAFVVGAAFAQSSTTIIGKQLVEQGEDQARHARLGLGMSVFQDITAVPLVIVIPLLGAAGAAGAGGFAAPLAWALAKAALAFVLVFGLGRRLLRPLFLRVAARRSAELFTLTVLFVSLAAGAVTQSLGLSMAFGAFLAGMVLGETEFRHQVEATVRPLRDVLLGLFFVGIGMLVDPAMLARVWHWGLLGAAVLLVVKALLVTALVRAARMDSATAWRTGLLLAVGGEFGFAVLAIGLQAGAIDAASGQAVLAAVLFSMVLGPLLIRHNGMLVARLVAPAKAPAKLATETPPVVAPQVLLAGYGRVGQQLGQFLAAEGIAYAALDMDVERVAEARRVGEPVYFGDSTELELLHGLGLAQARLLVITHNDLPAAQRLLLQLRSHHPALLVMVRTRNLEQAQALRAAGATEAFPETLEAALTIAAHALLLLDLPQARVLQRVQAERARHQMRR